MFFGQFEHNLDAKGRLTIPATFREQALDGLYVTEGFEANLVVYTLRDFEQIASNLSRLSITNAESRALRRKIFSSSAKVSYDTAGRILIPANLRAVAGIEDAVVIAGAGDYFELWSAKTWAKENASLNDSGMNSSRWEAFDIPTRGA
ncbi:MAG: division/cell wall cluster transcriptional repressor MraZ [Anaerolineaceae bacterium]|nr:division/cell wall cluster transcriptional repressor MraZ [Anaerolineaceae bacterium]